MMSPAGRDRGRIAGRLFLRIGNHVEQNDLGEAYAAETGFLIRQSPDTVRAPDVSFVSQTRLSAFCGRGGYLPVAPDLVAEVISPIDRSSEVESKALVWLNSGVRVVLVVDPQTSTLQILKPGSPPEAHRDGFADLNDVLPGFQLDVAELFA
jgi:Uma2 family endonuclease